MLRALYKTRTRRIISFYLLIALITEVIYPTAAMALTSGPSTPEVQSFEPISTSDMVDVFTGDFKYNIPLMDIGGYPINMAYNSGISTDQEASWVGLGWNLNPGNINRGMRGLPDDFDGTDKVEKAFNMKPNRTFGINAGFDFEVFGYVKTKKPGTKKKLKFKPRVGVGVNYNTYKGFGVEVSAGIGISSGVSGKGLDASLGLHSSVTGGLDISPNVSYSNKTDKTVQKDQDLIATKAAGGGSIGGSFNTRAGLKQLSFNASFQKTTEKQSGNVNDGTFKSELLSAVNLSAGSGGSINFGLQSYVPHITMPMINNSIALSIKTSIHVFGVDGDLTIGGYYSSQKLAFNNKTMAAYGYMYAEKGQNNNDAMMDFNREKDGTFSRFTKNLPVTNFTYDVYSASGHGVGGTFRPFRHDVGHVFDNYSASTSDGASLGGELGGGNLFKGGIDFTITDVINSTEKWTQKNKAIKILSFKNKSTTALQDEPYYFRSVGEKTADAANSGIYAQLGADKAYAIELKQGGSNSANISAEQRLVESDGALSGLSFPSSFSHTNRQMRSQNFSVLTMKQAKDFGLQRNLYNTTGVPNSGGANAVHAYLGSPSKPNDHHIGEITVLNVDGGRYIYGLPAYNLLQKEVSFNISGSSPGCDGFVNYTANDASTSNKRGVDNNYSSTTLPAYAHSYLLTAIVSADYVDVSGNGPSDDDLGTYTKFHYKKIGGASNYKWRMPATASFKANYSEGSKSNTNDQSGSYTYGEKELWYLDEIETKNYIAIFQTSSRSDAKDVNNEHGGISSSVPSQQLDKITLYSKPEYKAATLLNPAIPIKTVHFKYDYSLCPNTTNSTGAGAGKLTLKSVFFTYGKSDRARFNAYNFTYATFNPSYNPKSYDRWGNYKPEPSGCSNDFSFPNAFLSNAEFPYTDQNKITQDQNAQAWHLNKIELPSGGEINISYESDDYAFVQNMPAGQMYSVIGSSVNQPTSLISNTNAFTPSLPLFNTSGSPYQNYNYLIIKGIPTTIASNADFGKYCIKDLQGGNKKMFFKFLVNLTNASANNPNYYEYVSGYADIEAGPGVGYGVLGSGSGQAWIKLKPVGIKRQQSSNNLINPISLAAIQFGRLNYGDAVWGGNFNPPADVEDALKQLANQALGSLKTMITGFKNPNKSLADKGQCAEFVPQKSMVRLYNGNGKKLGGGSRVKEIQLSDKWSSMTTAGGGSQADSFYGQRYEYTVKNEDGISISSGVASYEPMIGGEENSMRQPLWFGSNKWTLLAPDDRYFTEGPYGESFYPSPTVGYSRVKTTSVLPANAPTDQRNGYKVQTFYTSKDYPTITESTPIIPKQHRPPLGNLLKIFSRDFIYTSQGFMVKTNDMHGKPKSEAEYAEGSETPMKETLYYFKTKSGSYYEPTQRSLYSDAIYNGNELENICKVIDKDGMVKDRTIGIDFDAISDFRESETKTTNVGSQNNLATFLVGVFPAVFPTVWPSYNKEISRFRSATLTKVVNQYAILDKTVIKENGAIVESENLAYDAITGDVLVTRTKNSFGDNIYNLKYPSYWGYDLMGPAFKNVGIELTSSSAISSGIGNISNASSYLNVGDEVGITGGSNSINAWVCSISGNSVGFIDRLGNPVSTSGTSIKVLRSANRNLLNSEMSTLTSLENPLPSSPGSPISITGSQKVLNAGGTLYSDVWQMPKGKVIIPSGNNCSCSISTSGMDLVNHINALMNTPNNNPLGGNGFFNNAYNPPILINTSIFTGSRLKETTIWRDPSLPCSPASPWPEGCSFPGGYINAPIPAAPSYNNYGLTPNVLSLLPYNTNVECTPQPNAPYVTWMGPPQTGGSFNSLGQLIGAYYTCDDGCKLVIDCGSLPSTERTTLEGYFANLKPNVANFSIAFIPLTNQTNCAGSQILCNIQVKNGSNTIIYNSSVPITIFMPCVTMGLVTCSGGSGASNIICGKLSGDKVNPYTVGIKGNWRPKINYTYLTTRKQTLASGAGNNNTDIRRDGYFNTFSPLYSPAGGAPWSLNTLNWTNTVESTKYNTFGIEVETKDALNRFSSALYGYNESLPMAVASNSQLREMAFDGFEDYDYYPSTCNRETHFTFQEAITNGQAARNAFNSHTGKFSLSVANNQQADLVKKVTNVQQTSGSSATYCNYLLGDYDFIYPFSPVTNAATTTKYVVSYWMKQEQVVGNAAPLNYVNSQLEVLNSIGILFPISSQKRSTIIDGWQRIEYMFTLPVNYNGDMTFRLKNTSGNVAFFDDIRVHPFSGSMKSYVYHPVTLKHVAELDANNFATFYEYDEQGNLIRVKKETERGIMTIQESKTHYKK